MLHGWMQNMGTAEALLASGDLACSLRYEDLVERKQATLPLILPLPLPLPLTWSDCCSSASYPQP